MAGQKIPTAGDWTDKCPWQSAKVLLIANVGQGLRQAHSTTDKRTLVLEAKEKEAPVLVIWPGEWSSSARALTGARDLESVYRSLLTPTMRKKYDETGRP